MKSVGTMILSLLVGIVCAAGDAGAQEMKGSNGSFGTYEISSDGSITLHIVGSTFPNWDGTKQKRLAAIKGDEMTWTNPTASVGGSTVTTLKRAKSGERYPQRDEK